MARTFGLRNQKGSCWVNACLQAIFRIPDVQDRLEDDEAVKSEIESCLEELWSTKGEEGLSHLYKLVHCEQMPAGEGMGDSHELLEHLCDKIPSLDALMRFKTLNKVTCNACKTVTSKHDSAIEFAIHPTGKGQSVSDAIVESVKIQKVEDWKCDKCGKAEGCTKQMLPSSKFPQVFTFHAPSPEASVTYSSVLCVNKINYALLAVVCYNGGHWWTYGRDMPPGKTWYEFNDSKVKTYDPSHFPLSKNARLLMYYRLNE